MRKPWTKEEDDLIIKMFPDCYTNELCQLLNRGYSSVAMRASFLGVQKSDDFRKMELQKQGERLKVSGAKNRFGKGHTPFNKGKEIDPETYAKISKTMFSKGSMPHNAIKDGEERLRKDKNGKLYIWIKPHNERKAKPKHIYLWESVHGKIPKGFNVIFKDKNQLNCTIENLECLSNKDLMMRNTIQRFPPELKSAIRLVNKLKRTTNAKEQN